MRILLINPTKNPIYPSGALSLLSSILRSQGHTVGVINNSSRLLRDVVEFDPSYVGITVNTFQVRATKLICKIVKGYRSKIKIVLGGPHISAIGNRFSSDFPFADIAISGEGERLLPDIILNKARFGYYHGKQIDDINYTGLPYVHRGQKSAYIMCSRGCPFKCIFCNKSVFGNNVRYRSVESVIREIDHLVANGVTDIFFQDDTFNLDHRWLRKLLNGIIINSLHRKARFKAPFRVNYILVTRDLLKLMKKAGFWHIFYGVESGNQEMLNRMKKGIVVEEVERAFRLTHEAGLKTTASFMIGNLGETKQAVSDSIRLMKKIKPWYSSFSLAIPFPGTVFRSELKKRGHLRDLSYDYYTPKTCVVRSDELDYSEMRKQWIKANLWTLAYSPGTLRARVKSLVNS